MEKLIEVLKKRNELSTGELFALRSSLLEAADAIAQMAVKNLKIRIIEGEGWYRECVGLEFSVVADGDPDSDDTYEHWIVDSLASNGERKHFYSNVAVHKEHCEFVSAGGNKEDLE